MGSINWKWLVIGVVTGIVLGPQIRKLPLVNKIPTV
jgi:Sec-independent protein translocase protein TatA